MRGISVRLKDPATGQEYSFNPARDIAYFYPQLIKLAAEGLVQQAWEPWYGDYLKSQGVLEQDLARTVHAFLTFAGWATDPDHMDMKQALVDSGFFKSPTAAQLVFCAKLGQLCVGAFWSGIRSATRMDEIPIGVKQLADAASDLKVLIDEKWGSQNEETGQCSA